MYPFPKDPERFRQKPEGHATKGPVEKRLRECVVGRAVRIDIREEEGANGLASAGSTVRGS